MLSAEITKWVALILAVGVVIFVIKAGMKILNILVKGNKKSFKEKTILYYIRSNNTYMLSDNKEYNLDNVLSCATLINYVPEDTETKFVNGLSKIDKDILGRISEIEYSKTSYDDERFLLYMTDGNQVYINISKIEMLNKYLSIIQKLDNKKGILYLDSGNYFEIKEK